MTDTEKLMQQVIDAQAAHIKTLEALAEERKPKIWPYFQFGQFRKDDPAVANEPYVWKQMLDEKKPEDGAAIDKARGA